jgi:murein DD-endopeptidase MepM/ murein hydrolase activator NlpD
MVRSREAQNTYLLPVPHDKLERIDMTSHAHIGKLTNAVDLIAPVRTPVLAARSGIVTYITDLFDKGGPSLSLWGYSNFVVIMHENGEYSRYDHLAFRSCRVFAGQRVEACQEIAKVGMTGYTYVPHLHFQVFVFTGLNIWEDYDTIKVRFEGKCKR